MTIDPNVPDVAIIIVGFIALCWIVGHAVRYISDRIFLDRDQ